MPGHKLKIPRTAHYYTVGKASKEVKYLWIITHGYGELASEFIEKFKVLEKPDTFVIAPEGLNKFYWGGGFTGKAVATWMTRHERLDEISDYANYLQTLYDLYVPQLNENVKIVLLGFSQGTATQLRWIMNKFPKYNDLILYAGLIPEDLDYLSRKDYFADKRILFNVGKEDPFLKGQRLEWQTAFAAEQGFDLEQWRFEGKHKVLEEEIVRIEEWVRRDGFR